MKTWTNNNCDQSTISTDKNWAGLNLLCVLHGLHSFGFPTSLTANSGVKRQTLEH